MRDFYALLGVPPEASTREIKSAFRKKAKLRHPDVGGKDDEALRLVLEAYRVLSNPVTRREYDRSRLRIIPGQPEASFDYRSWLKERMEDPEYLVKLIFYDLLHDLEDEAIELYDRTVGNEAARLERFFERPEAMDAEFCIAEEYIGRGRFVDAFRVMSKLVTMEQRAPGFGYFYDVVLSRFRHLVLDDLPKVLEPDALVDAIGEAVALKSSAENDAQFLRRKAELLHRAGRELEAREALARAEALAPRMAGIKALKMKLFGARLRDSMR